jgi:hypothetical protein
VKDISLKTTNTHTNNLSKQSEIDYRNPSRNYIMEDLEWKIYYEEGLAVENQRLYTDAREKLLSTLGELELALPSHSLNKLKRLKIFLMWGEDSPLGGKKSGMRYVRKGETKSRLYYDPKWENSIIIYSASNLVYLSKLWAKKALVHEFAHAWHITHWNDKHPAIYNTWKNSSINKLYTNVADINGKNIGSAYASKNQLEYFAELSAIYFVGGNYFPFNKQGLSRYDKEGHQLIEQLWKIH